MAAIHLNPDLPSLKEGDQAPDFSGVIETGETVSLKDYKGKKLVLYFYPKDDTPTCTTEACNLRDNYSTFKKKGYEILGVSPDNSKKHLKFIEKYELPFSLIADTDKAVIDAYGVWGKKKFMGRISEGIYRTTFVIDEDGKVEKVIKSVTAKVHNEQILS